VASIEAVNQRTRRWTRLVALEVAIWTVVAMFFAAQDYVSGLYRGGPTGPSAPVLHALSTCSIWMLLTPACIWLVDRVPLSRRRVGRFLAVHIPASIVFAVVHTCLFVGVRGYLFTPEGASIVGSVMVAFVHFDLAVYWIIVGGMLASGYYVKYHDREAQLARAELHALKAQLRPHFLFNTLNTISSLIRDEPLEAEAMLSRLGDLLRITLRDHQADEVSLADEFAFVDGYLEIEQARFGDRLRVTRHIDPAALDALVPHLVLQPLVENAVRHGVGPRLSGGTVELRAERRGGTLALEVRDDGVGAAEFAEGVGIANTRARLAHLYGADHQFAVSSSPGTGFSLAIEIPYRPRAGA
jgi:two-component system, LytTR family, sensor kinase